MKQRPIPFYLARFLFTIVYWTILAYLPIFLKDFGLRDDQIGILIGSYSLASLLLMLPLGIFADILSSRKILLFSTFTLFLHFVGLFYFKTFLPLFLTIFIGGLGAGGLITVLPALFLKYTGESKKEIAIFQAFNCLAYGVGPLIGGIFLKYGQINWLFYLIFFITFLLTISLYLLPDVKTTSFVLKDYLTDLRHPGVWFFVITTLILGLHFGTERTSLVLFLKENVGVSPLFIGLFFSAIGFWMGIISPLLGRIKTKSFFWLSLSLFWSGLFQFLTGFASNFSSFLLVRLLHTTGDTLLLLEISFITVLLFPGQRLGGHSGLLFTLRTLFTFIGASLAGVINQHLGYAWAFFISGLLSVSWALALHFTKWEPKPAQIHD